MSRIKIKLTALILNDFIILYTQHQRSLESVHFDKRRSILEHKNAAIHEKWHHKDLFFASYWAHNTSLIIGQTIPPVRDTACWSDPICWAKADTVGLQPNFTWKSLQNCLALSVTCLPSPTSPANTIHMPSSTFETLSMHRLSKRLKVGAAGVQSTIELSVVDMQTNGRPFSPALSAYFICDSSPSGLKMLMLLSYRVDLAKQVNCIPIKKSRHTSSECAILSHRLLLNLWHEIDPWNQRLSEKFAWVATWKKCASRKETDWNRLDWEPPTHFWKTRSVVHTSMTSQLPNLVTSAKLFKYRFKYEN